MDWTVIFDNPWQVISGKASAYFGDCEGEWFNALLADAVMGPINVYSTVEDLARWDEDF